MENKNVYEDFEKDSKSSSTLHFFFDENDELNHIGIASDGMSLEKFAKNNDLQEIVNIMLSAERQTLAKAEEAKFANTKKRVDELFKIPFDYK